MRPSRRKTTICRECGCAYRRIYRPTNSVRPTFPLGMAKLSRACQSMSSHPTIFGFNEFVLSIFATTCTFTLDTFAGHVGLSWALPHPSCSVHMRLGFGAWAVRFFWHYPSVRVRHLLLDPSLSTSPYGSIPTSFSGDEIGLLRSYISLV